MSKHKVYIKICDKPYQKDALNQLLLKELQLSSNTLLHFHKDTFGKPFLKDFPHCFFNKSYTKKLASIALSNSEIGSDLIEIESLSQGEILDISSKFFTFDELIYIKNEKNTLFAFYEVFNAKESLYKFLKKGLSIPLDTYSVLSQPLIIDQKMIYQYQILYEKSYLLTLTSSQKDISDVTIISL